MTYFRLKPVLRFAIKEQGCTLCWPFDYYMTLKALGKEIKFALLYQWGQVD